MKPDLILFCSDSSGIYIPRRFAREINRDCPECVTGVSPEEFAILEAGPENEQYWDCWNDVLNNAKVNDGNTTYSLYQDGDLWLVPEGMEWNEETEGFSWPADESDESDRNA